MAITFVAVGAVARGVGNLTAVAPAHSANDILLLCTGSIGTTDTITTPGSWTRETSTNNATSAACFALYDTTGSATIPTVNWSATNSAWAFVAVFRGIDSGLATCIATQDRANSSNKDLSLPAVTRTPSANNAIVLALAKKKKDATSDGTSWGVPSTFTTPGTTGVALTDAPNGTVDGCALAYWIQTTATLVGSGGTMTGTVNNTTAFTAQSFIFGFLAAAAAPDALLSWPKQTFVTETIIQS